jgi:nitrate/nitrite transport system permease protein
MMEAEKVVLGAGCSVLGSDGGSADGERLAVTAAERRAPSTQHQTRGRRELRLSAGARRAGSTVLSTCGGLGLMLAVWWLISRAAADLPGPAPTLAVLAALVRDPFYDHGPNDKGVALQIAGSLGRVFLGFGLGSLVAIPLGILMGASPWLRRLTYPIVQILRPVSPLAWFPIGLATFRSAPTATVFAIFITSLWPTLLNTAFGVGSLPEEYRNVARVFQFSRERYVRKILLPYSLPHILTGLKLSMGIAWMVIVAAEMLAGGSGIGFFLWDSWNALSLERVISAILLIGGVGLILDRGFDWVSRRFAYGVA